MSRLRRWASSLDDFWMISFWNHSVYGATVENRIVAAVI
jgi:hypothetical protein